MASDPVDLDTFEFNEQELLKSSNGVENDDFDDLDKQSDNGGDFEDENVSDAGSEVAEKQKSVPKRSAHDSEDEINEKDIFQDKKQRKKKSEKKKRSRESDKTSSKNRYVNFIDFDRIFDNC
jgi:hypothetical protein